MLKHSFWPWLLSCIVVLLWGLVAWPMTMSYSSIHPYDTLYGIAIFAVPPVFLGVGMLLYALLSKRGLWVLGSSGVVILIVTGCFAYAAVRNFYSIEAFRKAQRESISNLHALDSAMVFYADDHHGRLPRASRWVAEVRPYVTRASIFRCPTNPAPGRVGYGFNANLSGKKLAEIQNPENTVMLFETASPGENPVGTSDKDVWHARRDDESAFVITASGNIGVLTHNKERNEPLAPHW